MKNNNKKKLRRLNRDTWPIMLNVTLKNFIRK